MQPRKSVISNHKIFAFVGFISAALITSLFVYRTTHNQNMTAINDGDTLIMPVGRDLKTIELVNTDNSDFTERNLYKHWTLMFFGFTHCNSVCPVTLEMISKTYPALHSAIPNLQVVFVSLDPERDDKKTLQAYTKSFNPSFVSVSGKIESVRKLQGQLGIYSAIDGTPDKNGDYQLQHTASIMLINPKGKWVGMFKYGMMPDNFKQSVLKAVSMGS